MRVFVAGASGAIGEPLIAELLRQGHSVVGMTTSETRAKVLEDAREPRRRSWMPLMPRQWRRR